MDKLPKYVEVSGSKQSPAIYGSLETGVALIQESEFDSLLVQQEASDLCYSVALGGSTKPLDMNVYALLTDAKKILFCPDFDIAGKHAWEHFKKRFPKRSGF